MSPPFGLRPGTSWLLAGAAAVIAFGVVARSLTYLRHGSIAIDEAMLALNIVTRSFAGLTRPLAFEQTAPVLLLWATRAIVLMGGISELTLRLIPFAAGIAFVPLVWCCARQLLRTPEAAALAAAVAAVCPIDMAYGNFLKPYAVDAAVAAALLAIALRVIAAPEQRARWAAFTATAVVAPFISAPSVFVTAAALGALAWAPAMRAAPHWRVRLATVSTLWAGSAAANFFSFQRETTGSDYLQRYWHDAFLRPPVGRMMDLVRERIGWGVQETFLGHTRPFPLAIRVLLALVAVMGLASITRRRGVWALALMAGPVAIAIAASAARLYPLSERTLLFAAPAVVISMIAGLEDVSGLVQSYSVASRAWALGVLGALVLVPPLADATVQVGLARRRGSLRAVVANLQGPAAAGTPVYVFGRDVPVWTYYTTDWRDPDTLRVRALMAAASSTGPNSGNRPARGQPVAREGLDLIVHSGSRDELIGVPTGMEAGAGGAVQNAPDHGWATNETMRIRAAANPNIWLFFVHCHNDCDSTLVDTLIAAGGRIERHYRNSEAQVYRYTRRQGP